MSKHLDSAVAVPANQLNAKVVLGIFEDHSEPLSWKFLVAAVGATTPLQIKKLRQVLKGLVRTHELSLIDGHLYQRRHAVQKSTQEKQLITQGEVSKVDGVLKVNRLSIAQAKKGDPVARAGDLVNYRVVANKAHVIGVIKYSELPVVGVLNLKGRSAVVEPLGRNFSGRMHLTERPTQAQHGDTVRAQIIGDNDRGLVGRFIEALPGTSVVQQAIESTLASLDIPTEWSEATIKATARLPKSVKRANFSQRQDLTDLPLVTIDGATAKDFDDALRLANASPFGLSSACYTNDRLEAFRFKTGIKAGMTGINNSTTGAEAHLPFGGVKESGNGSRESGIWVIESYSYWHAVNDELSGKLQLAQMDVEEIEMEEAEADYSGLA